MLKIQDQSDRKKYEPHLLSRSLLDSERYGERIFFGMMCVFFFFHLETTCLPEILLRSSILGTLYCSEFVSRCIGWGIF